jgi:hypothetical protein
MELSQSTLPPSARHARWFCLTKTIQVCFSQVRALRQSEAIALGRVETEVAGTR